MEELLGAMEKVKLELESMKAKMSSTQQSLAEKEAHLTTLRAERRRHLEEVLEMKYVMFFVHLIITVLAKKPKTVNQWRPKG